MEIKTIYVEAKKSRNFQTYSLGITAELSEGEDVIAVTKELQGKCRKQVMEQIELDVGVK